MQRVNQKILLAALAALTLGLVSPSGAQAQNSFSINFTGSGPSGTTYPLGFGTAAGLPSTTSSNWNDAVGTSGSILSLYDSAGKQPGVGFSFVGSSVGASGTAVTANGNSILTKGFVDINAPTDNISFTNIGYSKYNVYVFIDGAAASTAAYTIGTSVQAAQDKTSFNGTFQQASSTVPGDYLVFSGLSGASFSLKGASANAAPVDGIQIVQAVPEAGTAVGFGLMLAMGVAVMVVSRRKQRGTGV